MMSDMAISRSSSIRAGSAGGQSAAVSQRRAEQISICLCGSECRMRRQRYIRQAGQGVVGRQWLGGENIEGRVAQASRLQRLHHRVFIDKGAPGRVDENGIG